MARHVVARAADIPPGARKIVKVEGREVGVYPVVVINDAFPSSRVGEPFVKARGGFPEISVVECLAGLFERGRLLG